MRTVDDTNPPIMGAARRFIGREPAPVAHMIGTQPYSRSTTARDSWITALVTFGEGYHNYHHRFPNDYRNGVRWYQFDPTKWLIRTLEKVGLVRDLRRMRNEAIAQARVVAEDGRPTR